MQGLLAAISPLISLEKAGGSNHIITIDWKVCFLWVIFTCCKSEIDHVVRRSALSIATPCALCSRPSPWARLIRASLYHRGVPDWWTDMNWDCPFIQGEFRVPWNIRTWCGGSRREKSWEGGPHPHTQAAALGRAVCSQKEPLLSLSCSQSSSLCLLFSVCQSL